MYPVLLLPALALFCWGIFLMALNPTDRVVLAAGCLGVIVVLALWFHAANSRAAMADLQTQTRVLLSPLADRLHQAASLLQQIAEQQLISERAKGLAFRERERDAMRRAIREEIARRDWDAATKLANELEAVFGYTQEADRFREEIAGHRNVEMRQQVGEAMSLIEKHCRAEDWSAAAREADRLLKAYPVDPLVQRLPEDIDARRLDRKKQLLAEWNQAIARHDVDGSIDVLRSLDLYLTPQEATAMQETARRVFKDKLLLLGQQFTLAVKQHNWRDSIRVGQAIIAEFPNSRMAQEVRDKLELLQTRATETEPAAV